MSWLRLEIAQRTKGNLIGGAQECKGPRTETKEDLGFVVEHGLIERGRVKRERPRRQLLDQGHVLCHGLRGRDLGRHESLGMLDLLEDVGDRDVVGRDKLKRTANYVTKLGQTG